MSAVLSGNNHYHNLEQFNKTRRDTTKQFYEQYRSTIENRIEEGDSMQRIADYLNAEGYRTNYEGKFTACKVYQVLNLLELVTKNTSKNPNYVA